MANLFSGLEAFGLDKMSNLEVYASDDKNSGKSANSNHEEVAVITEQDYLFDKSYSCPVCDKEFKSKTVKTGKVKLISADTDLRPKYQHVDSLKYDVAVCPNCGYASLNRFFSFMTSAQARLIKENISSSFKGLGKEGDILTYDDAIARHKLALVNTIVKRSKLSERAYTCLKTAWLIRGKAENLVTMNAAQEKKDPKVVNEFKLLQKEELEFLLKAYEGFSDAIQKENFPMCGMDEHTTSYLLADLARRLGKMDEAFRWISRIIASRDANERIKAKARELKEILKQN